jgi:hypothetical protein|tara:strand:- start:247 stop:543 length:297 start_codon:yes stop_codon:yes gene_type:complete
MKDIYESIDDLNLHWFPVKNGWVFDDGDGGATAYLYEGGMIAIHQLTESRTDLPVDNTPWFCEQLMKFHCQIDDFIANSKDDYIHPDLEEIQTLFNKG